MNQPTKWEERLDDMHNLLVACVGYNYGPKPIERLDEIREQRGAYGHQVAKALSLTKSDTVLDMGSGCGFIARKVAPLVKEIHCADLNEDFLTFCRHELADTPNARCHAITYKDFTSLHGLGINKVYSTAVWIHFNFYDVVLNLRAINALLPQNGMIYFDFLEAAAIETGDRRIFREHLKSYSLNRDAIAILVQYNSSGAIRAAAKMAGFKVKDIHQVWEECFGATLVKIGRPDD